MARRLTFSPNDGAAIVDYNHAVFDRFVRRVRHLPGNAATRRRGIGHESLLDTFAHILNVHEVWLVYIVRGRTSDKDLRPLFEDARRHPKNWKAFDEYSKRVWRSINETVQGLTPRGLARKVKAFWMPGQYTVRDAIMQTTLEQANHLGEIIGALWQDDVKPPNMTWIDVRRAKSTARRPKP
ncbi:MAG: DinB family protein [Thermoplasmata archaeon]